MIRPIDSSSSNEVPFIGAAVLLLVTAVAVAIIMTQGWQLTPSLLSLSAPSGLALVMMVVGIVLKCRRSPTAKEAANLQAPSVPNDSSQNLDPTFKTPVHIPIAPGEQTPLRSRAVLDAPSQEKTQPAPAPIVQKSPAIGHFQDTFVPGLIGALEPFFIKLLQAYGRVTNQDNSAEFGSLRKELQELQSFAQEIVVDPHFLMADMLRHTIHALSIAQLETQSWARTVIMAAKFGTAAQLENAQAGWAAAKKRESLEDIRNYFASNDVATIHKGFVEVMAANYDLPFPDMREIARQTLECIWPKTLDNELKGKLTELKKQSNNPKAFRDSLIYLLYKDGYFSSSLLTPFLRHQLPASTKFAQQSAETLLAASLVQRLSNILAMMEATIRLFEQTLDTTTDVNLAMDCAFLCSEAAGYYDPLKVQANKSDLEQLAKGKLPSLSLDQSTQKDLSQVLPLFKGHPLKEVAANRGKISTGLWAVRTFPGTVGGFIQLFAGHILPPTQTKSGATITSILVKLLGPISQALAEGLFKHETKFHKEIRALAYKHTGPASDKLAQFSKQDNPTWEGFLEVIKGLLETIGNDLDKIAEKPLSKK